MIAAVAPIHEVPIAGVVVRFYEAPRGEDDLPWHSFEDICAAARLPRDARDELLRKARSYADVGLVTLPDGILIQSHAMAIGLIGAMLELGVVSPDFADAYTAAGVEALRQSHAGLTDAECFERVKAAARTLGVEVVLPS